MATGLYSHHVGRSIASSTAGSWMGFKSRRAKAGRRVSELALHPITSPHDLRAPEELLARVEMLWRVLRLDPYSNHRWTELHLGSADEDREPVGERWRRETENLAARAKSGDDKSLCALIQRDPRYLGSELAQAKLLLWRLECIFGNRRRTITGPTPNATAARVKIEDFARAVAYVTGQGSRSYLSPYELSSEMKRMSRLVEGVARAMSTRVMPDPVQIATDMGMDGTNGDIVAAIQELIADPNATRSVAEQILAARLGLKLGSLRRALTKARLIDDSEID